MAYRDDVAYALRLLEQGYTPEQVEGLLDRYRELTALSDPTNVLLKEVPMGRTRGPVEIIGVTTRSNTSENRVCAADNVPILIGQSYERVARTDGRIESYSLQCFEEEFGPRELYGD